MALSRDPEVWQAYMKEQFKSDRLMTVDLYLESENRTLTFEGDTAREILAALKKDIGAGHAGTYMFDYKGWSANTYSSSLSLYYRTQEDSGDGSYYDGSYSEDVQFSKDYTYLLAVLEKAGVKTEDLITYQSRYDEDFEKYAKETYYENPISPGETGEYRGPEESAIASEDAAIIGGADGPTEIILAPQTPEAIDESIDAQGA